MKKILLLLGLCCWSLPLKAAELPSCDDSALMAAVENKISAYYEEHPASNLVTRRRRILLRKNLHSFEEVDIAGFLPQESYAVADRMTARKINDGLTDQELRLCRSVASSLKIPVYLLIFKQKDGWYADIVNFISPLDGGNDFGVSF